jgi:antitoxin component YwqK of YwqJK toxin-antitoxin module
MKKYILIALVFIGTAAYAQDSITPKLEAKGDLILATYFHENGAIHQEGAFNVNGALQGLWTSYDFSGNKLTQGYYDSGVKTGKWFFWNANSLKEVDFVDSKITSVSEWNNKSELATVMK